jgi:pimeloyl-ACP methyl ester carboxylesterase
MNNTYFFHCYSKIDFAYLQDLMKKALRTIARWIPEAISLSLFIVNLLLRFINSIFSFDKPTDRKNNKPAIIIFEQWFTKNYWHVLMKKYLEKRGFQVYWTNYSLGKGGAEEGAKYLKEFIERNKIKDAVLVGISMGAFSSYVYLQRLGGWSNIKKFISIAGPFKGTPLAFAPDLLTNTAQIRPNSRFRKNLLDEPIRYPKRIVCIAAEADEIVAPSSSFLSRARNKLVGVSGHNFLHMFSSEVFATIAREARSAR